MSVEELKNSIRISVDDEEKDVIKVETIVGETWKVNQFNYNDLSVKEIIKNINQAIKQL